jgi:hypothetical protein
MGLVSVALGWQYCEQSCGVRSQSTVHTRKLFLCVFVLVISNITAQKNMLIIFSVAHILASIPLTEEMNTLIQYHWGDWIE